MNEILNFIKGSQWAILPNALESLVEIVNRNITEDAIKNFHACEVEKSALLPSGGIHIEGTRDSIIYDNVAIMFMDGPIFPRANMMTRYSGAVDIQSYTNDYKKLLANDSVKSIIQFIDSPGGYITGLVDSSDFIFNNKNVKPTISYVYGMAASGGLWIASASKEIVMSETSEMGSLGVAAIYRLTDEKDKKAGIKNIEIISNISPNKRLSVETDEGRKQIQKVVDDLGKIFVQRVARNRNVTEKKVLSDFGGGSMMVAQSAIDVGLADRISNLPQLIEDLNKKYSETNNYYFSKGVKMELTLEELKAKYPDIYNQVRDEGKKEGIAEGLTTGIVQENARIQSIENIDVPGSSSIVNALKFDSKQTVETISVAIIQKQTEELKNKKALIEADGKNTADKLKNVKDNNDDPNETTEQERKEYIANLQRGAKK